MSLHRSLKTKSGALNQHRNVLTRAERIAKLSEEDRFNASKQSALGLVKVRSIKVAAGKKPKKAEAEGAEGAAKPAAGGKAPAAAKAPAAKAAAPKK
ncbi:MAG: small basic protein [Phycisphaerales bacterium]|nr:small basic protein [Phycisphaerales bacterium]